MNNAIAILSKALPELDKAEESPVSLTPTYLDIDELEKGWEMRCFFGGFSTRIHEVEDRETGEVVEKELTSVVLIAQKDGQLETYESAAAVLVSTLQEKAKEGLVVQYETALKIIFKGKKKNKTNGNSSARWDVRLLQLAPAKAA